MTWSVSQLALTASTSNTSSYASSSYSPTASRLLVALVTASATVAAAPTFTGNGLTWTRQALNNVSTHTVAIFTALTGSSPSTGAGTFDCTGDSATGAVVEVLQIDGADLTTPVVQNNVDNGATGALPRVTFTLDTAADCLVVGVVRNNTNPPDCTVPTGFTQSSLTGYATPTSGHQGTYGQPGVVTGGTQIRWATNASTNWWTAGLELKASAVPGVGYPFRRKDGLYLPSSSFDAWRLPPGGWG